jgi:hypothetical protein
MSDTPEVDAFMTRIRGIDGDKHWVPANTARRLVRERDEWRKKFELSVDAVEIAARLARAESERDEVQAKYDTLAAENMLEVHKLCKERDELKMQLKVMQAERDVARISARKSDEAHDRVIGDLERADVMAGKAKELIARWDQPSWKDTAPTAGFIYALRDAVEAYEKTPK